MPRKKITPTETNSETIDITPAKAATTPKSRLSSKKPRKVEDSTEDRSTNELDVDLALSFRSREKKPVSDPPASPPARPNSAENAEAKPRKRLGQRATVSANENTKPSKTERLGSDKVVLTEDDAEIVAMFRSRDEASTVFTPQPASEQRQQRRNERQPRADRNQSNRRIERSDEEDLTTEESDSNQGTQRGESFELVEFEPTEVFDLEEDGAVVTVQMRTKVENRTLSKPSAHRENSRGENSRGRRERRNSSDDSQTSGTQISIREPKQEKAVEKVIIPPRALIEIPADAPQIVDRNGVPTLVRDTHVLPNFWFYGDVSSNSQVETVLDEIRQASESGVHVFVLGLTAVCEDKHMISLASNALSVLDRVVALDKSAQIIFRLDLVANKGWELDHTDAVYRTETNDLAEPSISSDSYWKMVEASLITFTNKLLSGQNSKNLLGIEFDKESWVIPASQSFDISLASKAKFKEWVGDRYQSDEVLLRASWFDGTVSFDSVRIPEIERKKNENRMVRLDRKERSIADYHLFLSDQTMLRIGDLAYAIKEASGGRLLVGTRYGVSLNNVLPSSGQLALGKLLRTPEIDFVTAPPSYKDRQPNGVASAATPIDSFALNGKLFVSLEDYKTSLSNRPEPDQNNPVIRTPQALEGVHFRAFGSAIAHRTGITWSDQWGNGWLTAASVWQRAKSITESMVRAMAAKQSDPDVAVFIDERAMGLLVGTKSFEKLVADVQESLGRAGLSYGIYLLSDLTHREKFPECKVHIFLNAWDIRQELRSAIKQRLHKGNKVLFWCYTAGLFDSGRESLERAREVTGIAIKPQPIFSKAGTSILDRRNPLSQAFPSGVIEADQQLEPTYFAIPEDGTLLGEYTQTGLPSFVVREVQGEEKGQVWTSVFLGEPTFNTELLRAMALKAGAHVWAFQDDVVQVRAPFLTIHCKGDGQRTIALPGKWSAFNLQTKEWAVVDSTHLKFASADGVTHTFLVGQTDELRRILEADPKALLRMTELPTRESNIRIDISNFDVPIMRMDEWASDQDIEDSVDDWYFKQPDDDYEEDASLAPGAIQHTSTGRRRRDRDKNRRGKRKETLAEQVDFEPTGAERVQEKGDVGLDILFRKRD